jgi:transposase
VIGESDDPRKEDRFVSGVDSTFETEARGVRRLEVINGALGRRRWSPEAKARIVAESLAPGVVVSEVARRHDLLPQQLFAWRHQARQGRLALPAEALSFVPVVAAAEVPSPSRSNQEVASPIPAGPATVIEVEIGGAVVRVPPGADGRLLAKVLRAVKALA